MPQTRQHIIGECPRRRYGPVEGVVMTQDEIRSFLSVCEGLDRTKGTVQFYRRKLQRLYQDLPEDKTIRHGKLYLSTRAGVESNIALLVEQAMERMLEQEQFSVGWEDV